MENREKLFVATELFYPEEAATAHYLTQIVIKLSEKYDIDVIAGSPVYNMNEDNCKDLPNNINVIRLGNKKINKNNIIKRLVRAILLSFRMKNYIAKHSKPKDKVLMVTNPAILALILPKWCKRHGRKITMIVHDVFPENTVAAGLLNNSSKLYSIAQKVYNSSYKCVDKFIVCGNDMKTIVQQKLGHVENEIIVIQNWGDTERIFPLNNSIDDSKLVIQFSGNMGRVQGFQTILGIISKIKNPIIKFVLRGNGAMFEDLKQRSTEYQNLVVEGKYSRAEENEVLNACDISLVSLDANMYGLGVPSKTYNSMAAGKPLLFIGPKDSEIYNMVINNEIGYAFDIEDTETIVSFLNKLTLESKDILKKMGIEARKCVESLYSKQKFLNMYYSNI